MIVRQKTGLLGPIRKSRSIPNVVENVQGNKQYNAACALSSTAAATTCITKQQTESITYTNGLPGHTRQGANICIHGKYIRRYSGNTASPCVTVTLKANPCVRTEYFHVHTPSAESNHTLAESEFYASAGLTTGVATLNLNAQLWSNKTYLDLKPDLNQFSLPNDLLDWKQMKDLFKIWSKGSNLVTAVAGARLNYKYGWKPTLGDLRALTEIVFELQGKLEIFKAQRGQIISARKTLQTESVVKIGDVYVDGNSRRVWRGQIDRKVHGYLVYQPLPVVVAGKLDETLRSLLAATGFELNPTILWDYIPFTFVVDYFVNVSDWLSSFKHSALELPIQILQVFMQNKERIQVDSNTLWNDDINYTFRPGLTPGTSSVSNFFHRLPCMPDLATFALLDAKLPSLSQAINLVALGTVLNAGKIRTFGRASRPAVAELKKSLGSNLAMKGKFASYYDYDNIVF